MSHGAHVKSLKMKVTMSPEPYVKLTFTIQTDVRL